MNVYNYKVGEKIFGNKFLAQLESHEKNIPIKFDLFEKEFDTVDWSKDPVQTWDQLLDIRVHQIAALNKPIVLAFSGGTDSLTIYNVFIRNNIKIDALYMKYKNDPREHLLYKNVLPFIEEERKKYGFEVIYIEESTESLTSLYDTPEWIFSDSQPKINFSISTGYRIEDSPNFNRNFNTDFVLVLGLEKPRIKIINGKFYSYQSDTTWDGYHDTRSEFFFVSPKLPELHVKQSYMLTRYIIDLHKKQNNPIEHYSDIHNIHKFDYYEYSVVGCGRSGDLANSHLQKRLNRINELIISDSSDVKYYGRSLTAFYDGLNDGSSYVKNYLEGIRMAHSDSVMGKLFKNSNNLYSVSDIESKYYELNLSI